MRMFSYKDTAGEEKFLEMIRAAEALLFASGNPLKRADIADVLGIDADSADEIIEALSDSLRDRRSALTIRNVAGGWQMTTRPEYYHVLEKLTKAVDRRLSQSALETLSIIAFRQQDEGVTKQEIEDIRGVHSERMLGQLIERELIEEAGRKNVPGRPILYKTTETFLCALGLADIDELPPLPAEEIPAPTAEKTEPEPPLPDDGSFLQYPKDDDDDKTEIKE